MSRSAALRGAVGAALVLARKDLRVALSYRVSFFLGYLSVGFSVVIAYFTSRVVGDGSTIVGSAEDYFRFLLVGMVVSGLVDTALNAAVGAARRDQIQGTLEAVVALPVGTGTLGLGWLLWPLTSMLIGSAFTLLISLPLGLWGVQPTWSIVFVTSVLVILVFSAIGLFGAAMVIAFQQGAGGITVVMAFLAVISGSVFPTSVMPEWLQTIAEVSPLKHALDAMRAAALDGASWSQTSTSLFTLAAMTAVILPAGVISLELALRRARRVGSLGRY